MPRMVEYKSNGSRGMSEPRITDKDLNWWHEFAATSEWTFAKTYAETAPHEYIVEGRSRGVTHEDMVRAAHVIHTFGQPGKYYSMTKIYLTSPNGKIRWWTEDERFSDTTLVNRATTERSYGIQNAISTSSGIDSPYDGIATAWDVAHAHNSGESERVKSLLSEVRGKYPPHVLDLGCGTGRVLDLSLASPDRYAGVDSSQAMLNMLVRKHPRVAALYPQDVSVALAAGTFTPGQFDWVFLDKSVALSDSERDQVSQIARLALIEVDGDIWTVHDVAESSVLRNLELSESIRAVL